MTANGYHPTLPTTAQLVSADKAMAGLVGLLMRRLVDLGVLTQQDVDDIIEGVRAS